MKIWHARIYLDWTDNENLYAVSREILERDVKELLLSMDDIQDNCENPDVLEAYVLNPINNLEKITDGLAYCSIEEVDLIEE